MKKPKISLDKDKLQQLVLLHIEKILLGIIVCMMLLVIWRGYSLPAFKEMTPQQLVDKSNQAKQYIDNPERWNEVSAERFEKAPFNVVEGVRKVLMASDPMAYMLVNTWSRPDFPKLSPREDPELFAPINLIVRPVVGAIASYPRNESELVDPLYPQLNEEDQRKLRAKQKAEAKKREKDAAKLGGGENGGMPGEGMPTRKGKKAKAGGTGEEGAPGPRGGGMPGGYAGGEYGGMGMPGDRYPESLQYGFAVQDATMTIARYMPSVTVMALVPIQKQTEEFDKRLSSSLDYEPRRDTPYYIDYRVQRADVTDLDPTAPIPDNLWQNVQRPEDAFKEMFGDQERNIAGLYAGFPPEVVDPTYLPGSMNPEFPNHPAPPYLQRDLWDLLTHPDVPLASFQSAYGELTGTAAAPKGPGGDDDAPLARVGGAGGMAGMPGGGEGGYGGRGGMMPGGPGGMMGGAPGGMMGGGMGGGMRGGMMGGGSAYAGMGGGFRPGLGRGGEEGSGGYGYGMNASTYTPPKYQLVRYTDTHVEPGRKYRYRIRLRLQDPNHPNLAWGFLSPSAASLHKSVRDRLAPIDEADKARPKDQLTGLPYRTYWRFTDWSEPSPVAELPPPGRVYALKVVPAAPQKIRQVDVFLNEPSAQAVAVVFDPAKGADVPAENDKVMRGTVLNFMPSEPVKLVHPVNKEVIEFPKEQKYNVTTNVVVADMMGGERIKSVSALPQPLAALGEMLVMDPSGKLHVHNEGQDIEQIRRFTVPKEDKTKTKAAADAAAGLSGETPVPGRRARSVCF